MIRNITLVVRVKVSERYLLYFSRYRPKTVLGSRRGAKNPKIYIMSILAMLGIDIVVLRAAESIPDVCFTLKQLVFKILIYLPHFDL